MVGQLGRKNIAFGFQVLHPGVSRAARVDDDVPQHWGVGGWPLYQSQLEVAVGWAGVVNGDR